MQSSQGNPVRTPIASVHNAVSPPDLDGHCRQSVGSPHNLTARSLYTHVGTSSVFWGEGIPRSRGNAQGLHAGKDRGRLFQVPGTRSERMSPWRPYGSVAASRKPRCPMDELSAAAM